MMNSTPVGSWSTIPPFSLLPATLMAHLAPALGGLAELMLSFCDRQTQADASVQRLAEFEETLAQRLREVGRAMVQWLYNDLEPQQREDLPPQVRFDGVFYQRSDRKTPNRLVATLFGTITLMRYLYRPIEERVPGIFPLELRLGLEAGRATPALANQVAQGAAQDPQQGVLQHLLDHYGVKWSAPLLRKVTASVSVGMSEHRHEAQVAKLLRLLEQADHSRGSRKPVLAVGRDGIMLPIRKESCFREGAVATVSVHDRAGKRLGTVYLGRMPEPLQPILSSQLTALLRDLLERWSGGGNPMPRLVYITDAGHHPTEYYRRVLCRMAHPRCPQQVLQWEWVLDYYHACEYISKVAEVLFRDGDERQRRAWAAKMRRWLKDKPGGIYRVLHSAAARRHGRDLRGGAGEYRKAYDYLREHIGELDYHGYRKRHLPIGSGVTEAGCKTVFTQRMKQSGMTWTLAGGQSVVDLRVIHLSGVWQPVRQAYLQTKDCPELRTQLRQHYRSCKEVA